jgi:xanthine dehydrogenase accessory factor
VGLACGGSIDVFVQQLDREWYATLRPFITGDRASVIVTEISGPIDLLGRQLIVKDDGQVVGSIAPEIDRAVLAAAQDVLCTGQSHRHTIAAPESIEIFLGVIAPAPEVIAVGGVHIAITLTQIAKVMGYRTTVIDPRGVFGTDARLPHVDRLIHFNSRRNRYAPVQTPGDHAGYRFVDCGLHECCSTCADRQRSGSSRDDIGSGTGPRRRAETHRVCRNVADRCVQRNR